MHDIGLTHITPFAALSILVSVTVAFLVHWGIYWLARRLFERTGINPVILPAIYHPTRWIVVLLALSAGLRTLALPPRIAGPMWIGWQMLFVMFIGWLVLNVMRAARTILESRSDITVADNLRARRRHTRLRILYRIAQSVIGFVVMALVLVTIPGVRSIGITLMASAGLVGLAVGAAAQPALKNLIAGIQMAFSEPIRLDDVVIVEGEWGRIEDISLTFVVVRIWDDRRLIVPVSYFLEKPFQNWTRRTSDLLGTVFLYVDPTADVRRIRAKLDEVVHANARWDKRVCILQVTDHSADSMELRCLVSAHDASQAFDLRCEVREAMLHFLRTEMPEAITRTRTRLEADDKVGDKPSLQNS